MSKSNGLRTVGHDETGVIEHLPIVESIPSRSRDVIRGLVFSFSLRTGVEVLRPRLLRRGGALRRRVMIMLEEMPDQPSFLGLNLQEEAQPERVEQAPREGVQEVESQA